MSNYQIPRAAGLIDCRALSQFCLLAALACGLLTGCRSTAYNVANLPPEYAAVSRTERGAIDLSRLAGKSATNDMVYPGDVLEITIATGAEREPPAATPARVAPEGVVNVPEVGPVPVAGLTLVQAEERVRGESIRRGYYLNPAVTVQLASRQTFRVTVSGEVDEPGVYEIPAAQCDLLAAIVAAGGMTEEAGDMIEVKQPTPLPEGAVQQVSYNGSPPPPSFRSQRFDLTELNTASGNDFSLVDGSRIMVTKRPPETIQVLGLVNRPGQFEHPADQEVHLLDAIALAGGLTMQIADKVHVIRTPVGSDTSIVIGATVSGAKQGGEANIRLQPGDVVSVEETPTTFVVQTMRDFFRFGFSSALPGF